MLKIAFITFITIALLTPILIKLLKHFQLIQPIRVELPMNQQLKKGTPLMGGIIFIVGVVLSLIFFAGMMNILLAVTFILFSFIGFLDDTRKAMFKDPKGISGKTKLILQFCFTGIVLHFLFTYFYLDTTVPIYSGYSLHLPLFLFLIIIILFIVGSANAINFTDGLDGLLSVVAIPTYLFFFMISENTSIQTFSIIMIACLVGFLMYNRFPAKVIMGDTGSLAIGATLAIMAVIEKVEVIVPVLFSVYFAEQFSVILQVIYYKRTRKRLFRLSPIHYHFSIKYGWSENKIVTIFGLVSLLSAFISWMYWKLFLY